MNAYFADVLVKVVISEKMFVFHVWPRIKEGEIGYEGVRSGGIE